MRFFFKYLLWLLSLSTVVIFYLLNTTLGYQTLGYFLENYLSKTTKNEVRVDTLDIGNYPYLTMSLNINRRANVTLEGEVNNTMIDMKYHLKGESFLLNQFYIQDRVDVEGKLSGAFSNLHIQGEGELFEGKGRYNLRRVPTHFKDMNVTLEQVNSQKVLTFFKQKVPLEGLVDVDAHFSYFSSSQKEGEMVVHMEQAFLPRVAFQTLFTLDSTVDFKPTEYLYHLTTEAQNGIFKINNGHYYPTTKRAEADYQLHFKELADFEALFKHKYYGTLETTGKMIYENGWMVQGDTENFGGDLGYVYKNARVDLDLKGVSLEQLFAQLSYPALFSAKLYGTLNYDTTSDIMVIKMDLKEARFKETGMTEMIYTTSGINIPSEVYDQSFFQGGYQNKMLFALLKIDNGENHFFLSDIKLNTQNSALTSNFEIKMEGQEIFGELYGTVQNPKVSIDMSRLLKYQMSKQLNGLLETEEGQAVKKELKSVQESVSEQLQKIDVEDVKEKAKSLLENFF